MRVVSCCCICCNGSKYDLVTIDLAKIGQMSCNPAMGGIAKGLILRENRFGRVFGNSYGPEYDSIPDVKQVKRAAYGVKCTGDRVLNT
jgi:tRNA U34 5-carboxymethylaminomethyl modifying enzyme MnmG/GidA